MKFMGRKVGLGVLRKNSKVDGHNAAEISVQDAKRDNGSSNPRFFSRPPVSRVIPQVHSEDCEREMPEHSKRSQRKMRTRITVFQGQKIEHRSTSDVWEDISESDASEYRESDLEDSDVELNDDMRVPKARSQGCRHFFDPELDGCVARYDGIVNGIFDITSVVGIDTPTDADRGFRIHGDRYDERESGCQIFDILSESDSENSMDSVENRRQQRQKRHRRRRKQQRKGDAFDWEEFFEVF